MRSAGHGPGSHAASRESRVTRMPPSQRAADFDTCAIAPTCSPRGDAFELELKNPARAIVAPPRAARRPRRELIERQPSAMTATPTQTQLPNGSGPAARLQPREAPSALPL